MRRIIPARAGFTVCAAAIPMWPRGSSPLARGLPPSVHENISKLWIIPARAGFTRDDARGCGPGGDHPRSRGVYFHDSCDAQSASWIIPARAGFTGQPADHIAPARDHPRSRGVYLHVIECNCGRRGSSPLARGLPRRVRPPGPGARIIPARAGFTRGDVFGGSRDQDHPRSRGVYV